MRHLASARKNLGGVSEMDWKQFMSGDFLMNVIGVIVGLWIWNKFLAKRL